MLTMAKEAKTKLGIGIEQMAKEYPRLFMGLVHHRTTKGRRMTFHDKPWLTAIYKDNSTHMVIVKCSQVHMTEHALCAMFTYAHKKKRGLYVLPSKEHRKTFVADRINRMKDFSPLYNDAIKIDVTESDSNVYKSIFGTGWKFVGSNVKKDFFEFPCEILFFDEYDELDQSNLWYAYDRVANAKNPIIWKFGNPTRDNFGIHAEFLKSDQKEWHVECEHCGKEQILDWYEHFVECTNGTWWLRNQQGKPICTQCGKPFDRLGHGRWIALNPGYNKTSGYRISRLFVNKSIKGGDIAWLYRKFIEAQHNPTALQNFHNNYLGVTYENVDFKVTREVLFRSVYENKDGIEFDPTLFRTVMGVDQGAKFTCVISMVWEGELIDVHYANVDRWSDVEKLERDFNVAITVVDAQGGGYAETRDFVKVRGSRWMCYYRPKDRIRGIEPYNLIYNEQIVETNRTECLDLMVKMLMQKTAHVRLDYEHADDGEFMRQMLEPARVTDSGGRPVWTKGKDHYFHASAYRYLAWRISGMKNSVSSKISWCVRDTNDKKVNKTTEKSNVRGIIGDTKTPIKNEPSKKSPRWHV